MKYFLSRGSRRPPRPSSPPEPEFDSLTGLYNWKTFLYQAARYRARYPRRALCMTCVDIDHFTLFNQMFGREAGDRYIQRLAECLKDFASRYGGVTGYFGADSFYYLCPDRPDLFDAMRETAVRELDARRLEMGYVAKIGVYRMDEPGRTVMDACDRAKTALSSIRKDYSHMIAWYDDAMEQPRNEYQLIQAVEKGLRKREFTFFLQPKCNMRNGKLVGAEALVRWIAPDGHIIHPDEFVPTLEHSGYISQVDSAVWEGVCAYQRACLDKGYRILPISVNISRTDFGHMDVTARFTDLMEQYHLPIECLELEITESSCVDGEYDLSQEITRLKTKGFRILMDDFGSGYSSLNSLKDIDIDILKMDLHFLRLDLSGTRTGNPNGVTRPDSASDHSSGDTSGNPSGDTSGGSDNGASQRTTVLEKGVNILETVIKMAHALRLPIVVEGVETAEQVELLTSFNCLYAQGYYYYAPVSKEDYEILLSDPGHLEPEGVQAWDAEPAIIQNLADLLFDKSAQPTG